MATFNGSLAHTLEFGKRINPRSETLRSTRTRLLSRRRRNPAGVHMHVLPWRSANKYRVLEHRRRQAQIAARRLLSVVQS